nr:MAG TPA: GIY-YIG nuclease superfamily protein [Bacteriophage sp.]
MEKFIVYCTTCTVNNKIYIGVHKTNKETFDGYLGCGVCIS